MPANLFDPRLQQLPLKVLKRYEHLLQRRYNALARRMFLVFLAVNYNREPHNRKPLCPACAAHYGDNLPCDEGKPVNSPHRKPK